jgi:hypothetical protein
MHPEFLHDWHKMLSLFPSRENSTNNRNSNRKIPTATHLITTAIQLVTVTTATATIDSASNTVTHQVTTEQQHTLREEQQNLPGKHTAETQLKPHHDMSQQQRLTSGRTTGAPQPQCLNSTSSSVVGVGGGFVQGLRLWQCNVLTECE